MKPAHSVQIKDILHATVGATCNLFLPEIKRFVVLSAGRAGSNLLLSLVRSHPKILQHGELFGEFQLQSELVRRRINYLGPRAYLDRRLSRMAIEHITGAKILYRHLESDFGEKYGIPGTGALLDHMLSKHNIRIVHLSRRDKLAVLISARLAYESGQWVKGSYGGRTVHMPVDWVRDRFAWLEGWEDRIAGVFPAERLLEMTYEELAADAAGEMWRLFAFLGIQPTPIHSHMSKQNRRPKSEVVENYAELCEAFVGTRYAPLFDE